MPMMMLFMARCADSPILENLSGLQRENASQRGRGERHKSVTSAKKKLKEHMGQQSYRVATYTCSICLQYSFRGYWGRGPPEGVPRHTEAATP